MSKRTYVMFAIDCSGSMQGIRYETVDAYNGMLTTVKERAHEGGETLAGLVQFNYQARVKCPPTPVRDLPWLQPGQYIVGGNTALWDAVGKCIETLKAQPFVDSKDTSCLVTVVTDGEENDSMFWNSHSLRAEIAKLEATGRWTFAFQVPKGAGAKLTRVFGIAPENIREWEQTSKGAQEMGASNSAGLAGYFAGRAAGQTATRSFYQPVTTDLSSVKAKAVTSKLTDVSDRVRLYEVQKESVIKEFVEAKTKKAYVHGQAYYQLMKRELIQPTKAVLIMEKGKGAVWSGDEARALIGLPKDVAAKVSPGNHANYDVFVQSASVNRKLPRGTKLLVDLQQTTAMTPTWVEPVPATT